jgi:nucleoside-diphosphate-sugar epimerase
MSAAPPLALVTGATGFVGRALIPVLQRGGWRVRAVGRDPARCPGGCEFVPLDMLQWKDWDATAKDAACVVHLAARVHVMNETGITALADFREANVEVTRRLAEAAARQGARRFILASSIKVNGESTGDTPFSEDDEARPVDAYGRSKLEAELALEEVCGATGLRATMFRPPLMYGPEAQGNFARILGWVRRGWPLPLEEVRNSRSLLFVGNFCSAILRALETPPARPTRTYLLSDGEDLSTPELVRRLAIAAGARARLFSCPVSVLRLAAGIAGRSSDVQRLTQSLTVDATRIRAELDWSPPYSVDEALRLTMGAAGAER